MATDTRTSLWRITAGQRWRYAGAIAAIACSTLLLFGAPLVGKYAIDALVAGDLAQALPGLREAAIALSGQPAMSAYLCLSAILSVLLTAGAGVLIYARGRLAAQASEAIARRLRERLYARLHQALESFYDESDTGDLVQRCTSDVETLRVFLSGDVAEVGRSLMLLACAIPILCWLDWRLAAVALCLLPFIAIGAYGFFARVQQFFQVTDEAEGAMTTALQENLTGVRVVRAFARQQYEIDKFATRNAAFRDANYRLIRLLGLYWSIGDFLAMLQVGLVLVAGASFVMQGTLSVGTLFAFLTYTAMVVWPVRALGRVLTESGKAVVSLGRINGILDAAGEPAGGDTDCGRARGAIDFEHLDFGYAPEHLVLRDVSVRIVPGETLAIVGPPGAGKSSIVRVLLRLYPYQAGSVRLDGREIAGIDRQWLRAQFGVVLQDPFIYARSVRANLAVGRADALEPEMVQVCRDAAIHESIVDFPEQFETRVGERGITLSGGQRQRLALARALLKDPAVLILDDSLSAIDTETEREILGALQRRHGRRTTLIIAHRLSSIAHADRVLVLDRGRVVQLGTHAALRAIPGPYQRLWRIQGALEASIQRDLETTA